MAVASSRRALAERLPMASVLTSPWLWVGVVMAAALIVAIPYVLRFSQYVVMPDELGYSKQALWFAEHHRPSLEGDPWFNSYAQLGPLLFAPAYGLFAITTAFDVSHVISAVVFVSAAIPVFLLARLVTRDGAAAVLAAALSIAVPWLAMTATLMTEPIAYPASAWALLAMTRALERPSWRRDLAALLAILLATFARTQLVILGPAFVVAAVVVVLAPADGARPRPVTVLRAHWLLAAAAVVGAVALASPSIRSALLGSYAGPLTGQLLPSGTWPAGRELVTYVVVGIGGVPLALAAAWIALTLAGRAAVTPARAFAAVALCSGVLLVVMAGAFTARLEAGINDRYVIFIVPVLVVASVAMLVERRPATIPLSVAGLLTGALIATAHLTQSGPSLVSPSQTFHQVLFGKTAELGAALGMRSLSMPLLVGAAVAVAVVVLAVARRRWPIRALGLGAAVALLAANLVQTAYTLRSTAKTQADVSPAFLAGRDWLDREVPGDAPIAAVLGTMFEPSSTPAAWWDLTFWSKRLDRLYREPGAVRDEQGFAHTLAIDQRTGRLPGLDGRDLIVTTGEEKRFSLRGATAVAQRNGFVVWRAPHPYTAAWTLQAQSDLGDVSVGKRGTLRVFGDGNPETRLVTLTVTPSPYSGQGYELRASADGAVRTRWVPFGESRAVRLPLTVPASGPAMIRLDVIDRHPAAGAPSTGLRIAAVVVAPA
jgi:hypothetical protein